MYKSEISEKYKHFITEIARLSPNEKLKEDLNYEYENAELILEKVKMVG